MADNKKIDVFGIGNALVDTIAFVEDDFIREHDLNRGTMTLTDADTQGRLLAALEGSKVELHSGGSAANTMLGVAISGGSAFYNGKVSRDSNGEFYRQDLLKFGIHFDVHPAGEGPTGTCIVLTTPDAERTMYTNLGVSIGLQADDIDTDKLEQCKYVYLEGYLFDAENPRAACYKAAEHAKKSGVKTTLTFSDPFCVGRFKDDFLALTRDYCDAIFCNADEARSFADTDDLDAAAKHIGGLVDLAFITNSEKGALVVQAGNIVSVDGFPCTPLDTTGAGDAFAAGVLFGLSHDYSPEKAARWGNYLASETVKISGARLTESRKHELSSVLG